MHSFLTRTQDEKESSEFLNDFGSAVEQMERSWWSGGVGAANLPIAQPGSRGYVLKIFS